MHNLKQFLEELKYTIEEINFANETGLWHQNFALCSSYPGFGFPSTPCKYKMICDCPNWEDGARFYEKKKPFNPLKIEAI